MAGILDMHSTSNNGDVSPQRAQQACAACRKQKRRCDKRLPECSLCQRTSRKCSYSEISSVRNPDDLILLKQEVAELKQQLQSNGSSFMDFGRPVYNGHKNVPSNGFSACVSAAAAASSTTFPSLFFLDSDIFQEARMTIPKPVISVPQEIIATIGSVADIRDVVERYFENVHNWLPIISKSRIILAFENPQPDLSVDVALLLLSMKLISQPASGNPQSCQTSLYRLVRGQISLLESTGLLSLQLIQSMLLLAAFEVGHAIYPAAYLTAGQCARMGHLMGLNDRQGVPQILRTSGSWAELEERKRAWWACMLFERYTNLGMQGRPPATEDPPPNTVLPANEIFWDQGEMTASEPLYLSSPTSTRAGGFARTCQAVHLLGRFMRLMNDRLYQSPFLFVEAAQLYRTLTAFANLLPDEVQQATLQYVTSLSLCYGTILRLCDPFCCTEKNTREHTMEEIEMQDTAIVGMKRTAAEVFQLCQILRSMMVDNLAATSPLIADCLYQAASTFAWEVYELGSQESVRSYHVIRETLTMMNNRWAIAGEYLKALNITREVLYKNDPKL